MNDKNFMVALGGDYFEADEICELLGISRQALKIRLRLAKGEISRAIPKTVIKQIKKQHSEAPATEKLKQRKAANRKKQLISVPTSTEIHHNGFCLSLSEWSKLKGIRVQTIISRIRAGWPEEILLTQQSSHPVDVNGIATDPEAWLCCTPEQIKVLREFELITQTARWE